MKIVIKQSQQFWLPTLKLGPPVSSALCLWYNLGDSYQRAYLTYFSIRVGIFSLKNTVLFTPWNSVCFCWTEFQVIIWSANVYVWRDVSISTPCSCPFKDGFSLRYPGKNLVCIMSSSKSVLSYTLIWPTLKSWISTGNFSISLLPYFFSRCCYHIDS